MQTLTPKERLTAYELALTDYQNGIGKEEDSLFDNALDAGLCFYFTHVQGIDVDGRMEEVLPELYLQKPNPTPDYGYWFEWDELTPRIECLKKAIELTKKTYNL